MTDDSPRIPAQFISRPLEYSVKADEPFDILHDIGRPPAGWQIVYSTAPVSLYQHPEDGQPDPRHILRLRASASATIRVVLLA